MNYLFDTNILVHYVRRSPLVTQIEADFKPASPEHTVLIAVVSLGEIQSLAIQNNWGGKRMGVLNEILKEYLVADINSADVIQRYAEIDAFSQGKLADKPLGMTSRNMTKNDLWIAAVASVLDATLITTDSDFDHLNRAFINLVKI